MNLKNLNLNIFKFMFKLIIQTDSVREELGKSDKENLNFQRNYSGWRLDSGSQSSQNLKQRNLNFKFKLIFNLKLELES